MKKALYLVSLLSFAFVQGEQTINSENEAVSQTSNDDVNINNLGSTLFNDDFMKQMGELIEALRSVDPAFIDSLLNEIDNFKLDSENSALSNEKPQDNSNASASDSSNSKINSSNDSTNELPENGQANHTNFENNEL